MPTASRTLSKGERTRGDILRQALDLASTLGLEGVTIGSLASKVGMSKSGLYAHFDSKEALQCAVLDAAAERFIEVVITPTLKAPRGIPRLELLFSLWVKWEDEEHPGGCPVIAAATDFDDRPGPVRDAVAEYISQMNAFTARAASIAVQEGQFAADLDTRQFAYEFYGILLAHQQYRRLLGDSDALGLARRAFRRLVDRSAPLAS